MIKTNSNSKPYDVICNWERKKELSIIGNDCFKFKVNVIDENNIDDNIEISWTVEIFCIHSDFLVKTKENNYINNDHYFVNCDCCCNNSNCYYNEFFTNENWKKVDKEKLKRLELESKTKTNPPKCNNLFGNPYQSKKSNNLFS